MIACKESAAVSEYDVAIYNRLRAYHCPMSRVNNNPNRWALNFRNLVSR